MRIDKRLPLRLSATLAVALALGAGCAQPEPPAGPEAIFGVLEDGGNYRAVMPPDWNGTLVLDLDFANDLEAESSGVERWMVANGYAIGGISREPVSYRFPQAADDLMAIRQMVIDQWGAEPSRTISFGVSRGAFVSRITIERYPDVFDGAVMSAGGGQGEIAHFNSKLDGVWSLATLTGTPLKLVGFATRDEAGEDTRAMGTLIDELRTTPDGRARLALAGALEQLPRWATGDTPPAADDYEGQVDQIAAGFRAGNPVAVRYGIEAVAGGNVSWNHGVDYADMLERSGMADLVEQAYAAAGLDLDADLATLAATPRIGADPAAVATAEELMSYTGRIEDPVIVVDNIGDPFDPDSFDRAWERTVADAGNAALLRTTWVRSSAHATQSDLERLTGFVALIERLDTGAWGDTSPAGMQARAEALDAATDVDLGPARFIDHTPPEPLRPWNGTNWGSYVPCAGLDPATHTCG